MSGVSGVRRVEGGGVRSGVNSLTVKEGKNLFYW